jgi:hypothetical protein
MDVILEIYHLIRRLVSRKDPATKVLLKTDNLSTKLLQGFFSGTYTSDEQAAKDLYPDTRRGRANYRQLKYTLVNNLTNVLFFLNLRSPKYSQYAINSYKTKKEVFVAELLEMFQSRQALKYILSRTIKTAEEYDQTFVLLRCYSMMRNLHSKFGPREEYIRFRKLADETLVIVTAEQNAQSLRTDLVSLMSAQLMPGTREVLKLKNELPKLERDLAQNNTRSLHANYMELAGSIFRLLGDYEAARSVYFNYLQFLDENKRFDFRAQRVVTLHYMARCELFCGNHASAASYSAAAQDLEDIGTNNWFAVAEVYLLICLHAADYRKAAELFRWAIGLKQMKQLERRLEVWSIFEAYMRLLIQDETLLPAKETVRGTSFSLNYTLEELSETRQEKSGMYCAILIFQLLHYLHQRHFELVESRFNAIRDLLYRHIRPLDEVGRFNRTEILIRVFGQMINHEYNYSKVKLTSKSLLDGLSNSGYGSAQDQGGLALEEIVPYEHLVELLLSELQNIEKEGVITHPA